MPPRPPRAPVRVTASIRRESLPRPGSRGPRWAWDDVLDAPPPSEAGAPREGTYAVRHGFGDEDAEVRVGYATLVETRFDAEGALEVRVDERIAVEPRFLSQVLVVEESVTRRVAVGSRAGLRLVASGSARLSQHVGGKPGKAIEKGTGATVRAVRWIGRSVGGAVHTVVSAPDRFWAGAREADAHLARKRDRRVLLRGLADPASLSREGKAAALFLVLAGVGLLALAATLGIALLRPELASAWRTFLGFFARGVVGTVVLPLFPELQLLEVAREIGAPAAIAAAALGMTLGAWIVLFLGEEIHGALRRSSRTRPRLARVLDRAERFAARYGFWTAFGVLAIPLGPDTPVFYVLATVRTPLPKYLLGTLLGTTFRFTVFYAMSARYYVV